jgi:hypothetical protein
MSPPVILVLQVPLLQVRSQFLLDAEHTSWYDKERSGLIAVYLGAYL